MSSKPGSPRNYYDLLQLQAGCSTEEIRAGFRRQIALYHPDKVAHLAEEFQLLAAQRTGELIEAYNTLGDEENRRAYDERLRAAARESGGVPGAGLREAGQGGSRPEAAPPCADSGIDSFVRESTILRLRRGIELHLPDARALRLHGFDLAYVRRPRRSLFKSGASSLRVLARIVQSVGAETIQQTWRLAAGRGGGPGDSAFLFLMGMDLDPECRIADAILDERVRMEGRGGEILMVPVSVRTWTVLLPRQAPDSLRAIVAELRNDL